MEITGSNPVGGTTSDVVDLDPVAAVGAIQQQQLGVVRHRAPSEDIGLGDLPYSGPTAALTDVWRALRASMRSVLEQTTLADVATGALPGHVIGLADNYRAQETERGHRRPSA